MRLQQMLRQAKSLQNILPLEYLAFQEEIQKLAHTGQMPDASFQAKMEGFGKQIQGNSLLSEFFTKQQQLAIYLSDIEKIVFEPVSELLK